MKPLRNKTTKNLIIILAITAILSGLLPNYVRAATDTENGGKMLKPICQFVVYLCDEVMQWMQNTFTSTDDLEQVNGDYAYNFQYSPAIIFSGDVPALDVNFIEDKSKFEIKNSVSGMNLNKAELISSGTYTPSVNDKKNEIISKIKEDYKYDEKNEIYVELKEETITYAESGNTLESGSKVIRIGGTNYNPSEIKLINAWVGSDKSIVYLIIEYEYTKVNPGQNAVELSCGEIRLYKAERKFTEYESTAKKLQGTISTWYNALRRIALVGLLSVLVYVGIRIVLTSSSGDKAKYKGMLKDWLVAICLLFTLHYIMNATLVIVNEISNIFSTGETDPLLNQLRTQISTGSWGAVLAQTIMYVVIVIFTITFTIQYLMRVIYMAFYTLIAPLITLTYPLDKIKDGQAQAFSMWIKEYIFTALIQVIHLVIYFVLVSSAMALVKDYPLFAIIVMAFIKKAEGIIKKMFGFEKSETVGALGAAATGALAMNAINSIKGIGGKKGKSGGDSGTGGGSSNNNVRTATTNPLVAISGGTEGSAVNASSSGAQGNGGTSGTSGASRKFKTKR